jgi:hypothetical protein
MASKELDKAAELYAVENYPYWEDCTAYWDKKKEIRSK